MRTIEIVATGGVEVLQWKDRPVPQPGDGEVLVQNRFIGVNFVDTYYRRGVYSAPLPLVLGMEGGGTVAAVGKGVADVKSGDQVTFAMQLGAYAEFTAVPAGKVVPVPPGLDLKLATAATLQGLTATFLTHHTYAVRPGDQVLIHAGSGGVGQLLVQLAKIAGARVLTTVSNVEKAEIARAKGAHEVLDYDDFPARVRALTDGLGVHVVYDSVGKTTFMGSLDCLCKRGMLVLFGQSSGPAPPLDPQILRPKGSVYLTRPSLSHYMDPRELLLGMADTLFGHIRAGRLQVHVDQVYPFAEAAEAHRYIAGRKTKGKILLTL